MRTREEVALDALEGMVHQFAYWSNGALATGGLSALEEAFEVLGWDDPHPEPEFCCQWPGGCKERGTCGTPVAADDPHYAGKRYVRTCHEHSPWNLRRAAG